MVVATLNKIKHDKKKFLITMLIIIASATLINYAIYNLLDFYFNDMVNATYKGIQVNMLFTVITIGIVILIMVVILPKDSVNELVSQIDGEESDNHKTPEQILQDIVDKNGYEEENNNKNR